MAAIVGALGLVQLLLAAAPPAEEGGRATAQWVYFVDRAESPTVVREQLEERGRRLAPRARDRRQRVLGSSWVRVDDLPPSDERIAAVASTGARVRVASAWLNAVSVSATPVELARVRALAEVRRIAPMRSMSGAAAPRGGSPSASGSAAAPPNAATLDAVGVSALHDCGWSGAGVIVGVLDTGFALDHPALAGVEVLAAHDFVQGDDEVGNQAGDDLAQEDHGTAVLSLLAGDAEGGFRGVAPGVSVILAKTELVGAEEAYEEEWFVAGLEWIEAEGADLSLSSLGYDEWYDPAQFDGETAAVSIAVSAAVVRGMIHVNSAGNLGPAANTVHPPADSPDSLTVGAVDLEGTVVPSSSRGPTADGRAKPELVAPGVDVPVAVPPRGVADPSYAEASGTSVAAPLVAGVVALLLEAEPTLGPAEVRERLTASARAASGPDAAIGAGIVDGAAALGAGCTAARAEDEGCACAVRPRAGAAMMLLAGLLAVFGGRRPRRSAIEADVEANRRAGAARPPCDLER